MKWKKLGLVYCPDGTYSWAQTHAMIPTPFRLNDDVIRVFVTCCDEQGRGRPGYVDVLANDPEKVIRISPNPLLELGQPGTFDENGILACSVIRMDDGRLFMYYVGFELGTRIRYRLLTGLAISDDDGESFQRYSKTPVLERSDEELFFRGGPWAIKTDEGVRLWYVAGSEWIDLNGKAMPVYDIRYMESDDGIHWPEQGTVQLPIEKTDEHGFGRPCVLSKPDGGYRLFYSVRRKSLGAYRLGYAESRDGYQWVRMDEVLNLDVTLGQFDSDAIMYAAPIQTEEALFVFYNGNRFGQDGMAVARLVEE